MTSPGHLPRRGAERWPPSSAVPPPPTSPEPPCRPLTPEQWGEDRPAAIRAGGTARRSWPPSLMSIAAPSPAALAKAPRRPKLCAGQGPGRPRPHRKPAAPRRANTRCVVGGAQAIRRGARKPPEPTRLYRTNRHQASKLMERRMPQRDQHPGRRPPTGGRRPGRAGRAQSRPTTSAKTRAFGAHRQGPSTASRRDASRARSHCPQEPLTTAADGPPQLPTRSATYRPRDCGASLLAFCPAWSLRPAARLSPTIGLPPGLPVPAATTGQVWAPRDDQAASPRRDAERASPGRPGVVLGGSRLGQDAHGAPNGCAPPVPLGVEDFRARPARRIALVGGGPSARWRSVMIEGISGLLGVHAPPRTPRPGRLPKTRSSGPMERMAQMFAADDPGTSLRGARSFDLCLVRRAGQVGRGPSRGLGYAAARPAPGASIPSRS